MGTMKPGRIDFGTREFRVKEVPIPAPGPGQVRVKVSAVGVCLSDVHLIGGLVGPLRNADAERTLGHEVAGTIDAWAPVSRDGRNSSSYRSKSLAQLKRRYCRVVVKPA